MSKAFKYAWEESALTHRGNYLWNPNEFTLEAIERNVTKLLENNISIEPIKQVGAILASDAYDILAELRSAVINVPVLYSPSNALAIADTFKKIERTFEESGKANTVICATFYFSSTSPSYKITDKATHLAISKIAQEGHEIGVLLEVGHDSTTEGLSNRLHADILALNKITKRYVGTVNLMNTDASPRHMARIEAELAKTFKDLHLTSTRDPAFKSPKIVTCTTANGMYIDAHPVEDFAKGKASTAVINLNESSFSQTPLPPRERLYTLPEVKAHKALVDALFSADIQRDFRFARTGTSKRMRI